MEAIDIIGTPLIVTTYGEFIGKCHDLATKGGCWAVDLTNTQIVTMRRHDPDFYRLTSTIDFFLPDGMPLIWCLNRRGAHLRDRVYGPTFMWRCVLASPAPFTHYLLGSSRECLERLHARLTSEQPALQIVGSHHGYFRTDEEAEIVNEINRLSPDFIWIGLGTPKQQDWIHRNKAQIRRGVLFAVGFAFDVNAGTKKDAPVWMQQCGLTWLFRISSEPRRLLKRYLKYNTLFLYYLVREKFGM